MIKTMCDPCKGKMFTCDMGNCSTCSNATTSGMFKHCRNCAVRLQQCMACGKKLGSRPITLPDILPSTNIIDTIRDRIENDDIVDFDGGNEIQGD